MKKAKRLGIILLGIILYTRFQDELTYMRESQERIAEEVLRFHVIANSDTKEDQSLKLKVKDRVVQYMREHLPDPADAKETKKWTIEHLSEIQKVAEQVVRDEDGNEKVRSEVTTCFFPEKTYGDITFPKGYYDALRIKIGEAKGKNWWCVLYPRLCFMDSVKAVVPKEGKEDLKTVLEEEDYQLLSQGVRFKIKWFFFPLQSE